MPKVPENQEEEKSRSVPVKQVKSIFAKIPTPFAGGSPSEPKNQRALQHRTWEPAPDHQLEDQNGRKDGIKPPLPVLEKTVAYQFNEPNSHSNEDLETKLKAFVRNEIENARKEFELQLEEEREQRMKLEELVSTLAAQVKQLLTWVQQ